MSIEANKAVVLKGWECAGRGDLDGVMTMYHENIVYHGSGGEEAKGKDAVKATLSGYLTAFPDIKTKVEDIFGEGDRVFSRVQVSGTNTGELMGMPATGKRLELRWIMNVSLFEDGKVIEEWEIFDGSDMMTQLGHMPERG